MGHERRARPAQLRPPARAHAERASGSAVARASAARRARPVAAGPTASASSSRRPSRTSGSRSASAAASICSGRRGHNPHVGLIGCEPFQDGVVKVLSAIERAAGSPTSGCMPTTPARCCAGCRRPASAAPSSCFPIPGRRSATTSAGSCPRRRWRAGPHHASRRRAAHRHRHRRLRALDPAGRARAAELRLDWRTARPTGASAARTGRRPATSRRPSQAGRRCYYFRFRRGVIAPASWCPDVECRSFTGHSAQCLAKRASFCLLSARS